MAGVKDARMGYFKFVRRLLTVKMKPPSAMHQSEKTNLNLALGIDLEYTLRQKRTCNHLA